MGTGCGVDVVGVSGWEAAGRCWGTGVQSRCILQPKVTKTAKEVGNTAERAGSGCKSSISSLQ